LGRLEDRWDACATKVSRSLDQSAGGRAEHDEDSGDEKENDDHPDHEVQHLP
jgi:hypothetical protein